MPHLSLLFLILLVELLVVGVHYLGAAVNHRLRNAFTLRLAREHLCEKYLHSTCSQLLFYPAYQK